MSAKKTTAKKAARKATAKTAGRAGTTKKATASKATAKTAARTATAKTAARTATTKKATARKATAKKAVKKATAKAVAAKAPASGLFARYEALLAELVGPDVDILAQWQGRPMVAGLAKDLERKLGAKLDPALVEVYTQANGFGVVWVPQGSTSGMRTLKRGQAPTMMDLERLSGGAGAIAFWPIHEVFGFGRSAFFDYAKFMPGEPPHWGFDFPGNYYTPAYVRDGERVVVKVGEDHGAAWDGPAVSFERYFTGVLATWGLVDARRDVFIKGKGTAKPMTLDQAVAAAKKA